MPMLLPSVFLATALGFVNSLFRGCDSRRTVARRHPGGLTMHGPQDQRLRANTPDDLLVVSLRPGEPLSLSAPGGEEGFDSCPVAGA
jgi:hypothetical protein